MKLIVAIFYLFLLCYIPEQVFARGVEEHESYITSICKQWDVPVSLVLAIARQESANNPWAVNVAGKGYHPDSKEDALKVANKAYAAGRSFDIGLMQINSYWLKRLGFTPEYAIDPRRNITIGVWILAQEIKRYGIAWQAVASYHTPVSKNPERGKRYALSVINHIKKQNREKQQ